MAAESHTIRVALPRPRKLSPLRLSGPLSSLSCRERAASLSNSVSPFSRCVFFSFSLSLRPRRTRSRDAHDFNYKPHAACTRRVSCCSLEGRTLEMGRTRVARNRNRCILAGHRSIFDRWSGHEGVVNWRPFRCLISPSPRFRVSRGVAQVVDPSFCFGRDENELSNWMADIIDGGNISLRYRVTTLIFVVNWRSLRSSLLELVIDSFRTRNYFRLRRSQLGSWRGLSVSTYHKRSLIKKLAP